MDKLVLRRDVGGQPVYVQSWRYHPYKKDIMIEVMETSNLDYALNFSSMDDISSVKQKLKIAKGVNYQIVNIVSIWE